MRVLLSRMTVLYIEEGLDTMSAAKKGMAMFENKTGSEAGIIVVDKEGNYGYSTNAKAMPFAVISGTPDTLQSSTCLK
jgi:beta-aspartyl-peptidase (threonine type)